MINREKINDILEKAGLTDYKWINPAEEVFVAHWVRVKCQFGCGDYGLGTCPPNTPSVRDCARFFKEYSSGVIIRMVKYADKDPYPSDWSKEMTEKLLQVERAIFLADYPKVFLLNQTGCTECKECANNRTDCQDKTNARPTPEGFAVDVYQTVHHIGYELSVIADTPAEMNRYAILLIK